jgi:hypothetical protein
MRKQCLEFALPNPGEISKYLAGAYNSNSHTCRLFANLLFYSFLPHSP